MLTLAQTLRWVAMAGQWNFDPNVCIYEFCQIGKRQIKEGLALVYPIAFFFMKITIIVMPIYLGWNFGHCIDDPCISQRLFFSVIFGSQRINLFTVKYGRQPNNDAICSSSKQMQIIYNYLPKGRWVVVDNYKKLYWDVKRRRIYPPPFTDPDGDSCFRIYQISWM